jgi:hypothetical protein
MSPLQEAVMIGGEGAAFAMVSAIFLLFAFGLVVTYQGIVGRDLDLFTDIWGKRWNRWDPDSDTPRHPRDRHSLLRVGIGLALMTVAVLLAMLVV